MTERPIKVGWLAPEDCTLPLVANRGSISNDISQLTARLSDDLDILIGTAPHPTLGRSDVTVDGIRYTRADQSRDRRRGSYLSHLNQVQRKLGLRDLPYAGRTSYFRGFASTHAKRFARERVDVVHFHNNSQWAPILRSALPDARIVLQMHSEWLNEIPYGQGLARLKAVDRVFGVSRHVADQIRSRYPSLAEKVGVLRNGIDLDQFPSSELVRVRHAEEIESLRRSFGLAPGPVILFVGRISAEKGLHVLLEAFPRVLHRVPDARIVLVGEFAGLRSPLPTRERQELAEHPRWRSRYSERIRALAHEFGDHVVLPGHVAAQELPLLFALADVYVHPSMFEAFPLAVLEAMASALPVVATAVGGIPEQVVDGQTGLLVRYDDEAALAQALVRILEDGELARALGRAGREHAGRHLDWDEPAQQLLGEYERLLGRGHRSLRAVTR